MKKRWIVGNWKMNKTPTEAEVLTKAIVPLMEGSAHKIVIAPPFVSLPIVLACTRDSCVEVAAQNVGPVPSGAHTGEVSAPMLSEMGVQSVIIGHSERRRLYGERKDLINQKVRVALDNRLVVILCVGETLDERESGRALDVCRCQIEAGLAEVSPSRVVEGVVLAYEPVWAIGTGKTATPDDANSVHKACREKLVFLYGEKAASVPILYGGSVTPASAGDLMAMEHVDGGLIGGASLQADSFAAIARSAS